MTAQQGGETRCCRSRCSRPAGVRLHPAPRRAMGPGRRAHGRDARCCDAMRLRKPPCRRRMRLNLVRCRAGGQEAPSTSRAPCWAATHLRARPWQRSADDAQRPTASPPRPLPLALLRCGQRRATGARAPPVAASPCQVKHTRERLPPKQAGPPCSGLPRRPKSRPSQPLVPASQCGRCHGPLRQPTLHSAALLHCCTLCLCPAAAARRRRIRPSETVNRRLASVHVPAAVSQK